MDENKWNLGGAIGNSPFDVLLKPWDCNPTALARARGDRLERRDRGQRLAVRAEEGSVFPFGRPVRAVPEVGVDPLGGPVEHALAAPAGRRQDGLDRLLEELSLAVGGRWERRPAALLAVHRRPLGAG